MATSILIGVAAIGAVLVLYVGQDLGREVDEGPTVAFIMDQRMNTLQIQNIDGGPVDWADMRVVGCTAPATSGAMSAGQMLTDCDGSVIVAHRPSETTVFTGYFNPG